MFASFCREIPGAARRLRRSSMQSFRVYNGLAAPFPEVNVDTDRIIPKQFLKTIARKGLSEGLFYEMRHDEQGHFRPGFILDTEPWNNAGILITGANFGCGSSREHAPWALLDFGIRCLIGPSFADIFYNNCFRNGILPIRLGMSETRALLRDAEDAKQLTVDLVRQSITRENGDRMSFCVEEDNRKRLLEGLDDIAVTLESESDIEAFERSMPSWLVPRRSGG